NSGCTGLEIRTAYGVADSNTFDMNAQAIPIWVFDFQGETHGDESWAAPDSIGTANAMYFENNTINSNTGRVVGTDGWRGSRVVYRYNTFTNAVYSDHGTESSGR